MKRDGYTKSSWQSLPLYKPVNNVLPKSTIDVVIIGGGITGVSTALALQKAGKTCVIAEAQNIGFGTTSGTSGHLNTFIDTSYFNIIRDFGKEAALLVAQGARTAIESIERNTQEYKIACGFKRQPGYLFSEDKEQSDILNDIFKSTAEVGIPVSWVKTIPAPFSFKKAVRFDEQAEFHPVAYLYGITKAYEHAGGVLLENCRVTNVTGSSLLEVETSLGKIKAKNVIYATHIPPGVNILHFRCVPYRSYVLAVELSDKSYPEGLVYDMQFPYHYYRTWSSGNKKFLITGGEDHKTGHESSSKHFASLEKYIRKHYNVKKIHGQWSSQFYETVDGLPYIGHLPGNPENVYVATGFSGTGLMFGALSALILSDIIISGKSEYQKLFSPARVKPVAGFSNFLKEAADVVGQFVSKRMEVEQISSLSKLPRGEAKVVEYNGVSVAVYKDAKGKLYAVDPSCPHIKCVVGWNDAERSWDCPCHGSRFSFTGELLTGPARKDLSKYELKPEKNGKQEK